ncbi:nicotinamidase-related amidase [Dongia mobilis]|uniref:Nicotinamidase-related amidase n=1 Tax=Dongia mobilis TaxID=578943 RepID=A0A4R6WUI5_9PROT|nr:isochorismatase family protein [Dongia mobilis]TDQ84069.1 nicotinamidase-related amidase [Dongia mobilis]
MSLPHGLLERDQSCLVVIDVQQYFLAKLPLHERGPLVERIAWIIRVARLLDIPVIATAEDIARDGPMVPELAGELPAGTEIYDKMVFGLMGQADIAAAIAATGRLQCVLVGMETDVCIAHSAIGLMEAGNRVAVISDATATPPPHHEAGLQRMAQAGVTITNTKGLYYEWVRDLATDGRVRPQINRPLPAGLTL